MNYVDMLSQVGAGSAHPGGFLATLEQLSRFPLPPSGELLEVGCGTGRTACYLAEQGYLVTAVDIHTQMIKKAKKRAEMLGAKVEFIQADVMALPFSAHQFDILIAESVTNFTQTECALQEYYRVLKPGGVMYDREIIRMEAVPESIFSEFTSFFGIPRLLEQGEWLDQARESGFSKAEFVEIKSFDHATLDQQSKLSDPQQVIDEGAFTNQFVWDSMSRHTEIMIACIPYLAYGIMRMEK